MSKLAYLIKEVQEERQSIAKIEELLGRPLTEAELEELDLKQAAKKARNFLGAAAIAASTLGGGTAKAATPSGDSTNIKPTAVTKTVNTIKTNPSFWVKDTNDIKRVQNLFKAYRLWTLAQWKRDRALIVNDKKYYSQLSPDERKSIENSYMKDAPETKEDGKNGQFTSKFIFPEAFLHDLNTGRIEKLGLEGNEAYNIVNKVGITINQMKEWNAFVNWMKTNGISGTTNMNHEDFRDQVLQQYKGANTSNLGYTTNIKENKMTKDQLREAIRQLIRKELNEVTMWEPEVEEPEIDTDTETEEDEDDYTFTPKPGSLPDVVPKAETAPTAKEQDAIADLVKMYKAEKANLNEAGKTWAEGYEEGYKDGFKDSTQNKPNKFKK